MVISIIGLGETGTAIAHELMVKYQSIRINIIDTNENLDGRILDLAHAGVSNNNRIAFQNATWFDQSDFIFFCAGTRNKPGESREQMADANKKLISKVFDTCNFTQKPVVIVISNPVDAMTTWISQALSGKAQVIGTGTLLDTWRLKLILAQRFNIELDAVETAVVGEHGDTMVVLWSQTSVKGQLIAEMFGSQDLLAIEQELRASAKRIRQTENATKYGVGAVAVHLLDLFQSNSPTITIASIPGMKGDLCFGQRCAISALGIEEIEENGLSESELAALKLSIERIRSVLTNSID